MLRYVLHEAAALPAGQRIEPLDTLVGFAAGMPEEEASKKVEAFLDALYAGTRLPEKEFRLSLFDATTKAIVDTNDTAVKLAVALHPMAEAAREREKATEGKRSRLRPVYMRALLAQAAVGGERVGQERGVREGGEHAGSVRPGGARSSGAKGRSCFSSSTSRACSTGPTTRRRPPCR